MSKQNEARSAIDWVCLIGLLIGTFLIASPALGTINYILASLTVDDSYYYLLPAFNATHGQGLTFDGANPTNGFQPLWMLILLPLALISNNRELFLRLTIIYQAIIYAMGALLIVRTALRRGNTLLAILTVVLWMAFGWRHDLTASLTTNGLESALYFFMLALGFVVTLHASEKCSTTIGVLHTTVMALVVLTRLDAVFFAAPLSLYVAWQKVRRDGLQMAWRELLLGWGVGLVIVLAYVGWSMYTVGLSMPVSGLIKVFHARAQATNQFGGMATFAFVSHVFEVFSGSVALITGLVAGVILPLESTHLLRIRLIQAMADPYNALLLVSLLLGILIALMITVFKFRSNRASQWPTLLLIFGLSALIHLAFHSVSLWLYAYYNVWHYVGQIFWVLMLVTWATASLLRVIGERSRLLAATILTLLLLIVGYAQTEVVQQNLASLVKPFPLPASERASLYRAARWSDEHLPHGTRLGAFNAGIAGYFTSHSLTNLDGLINSPIIYQRLRNKEPIGGYIAEQGLDYLIDYSPGGAWPLPEVGGIHYFDLYTEQSAAFVMDTTVLTAQKTANQKAPLAVWLVTVRTSANTLESWVGTAWSATHSEDLFWRIADDQGQVIEGPFQPTTTWLPEVPAPPRANHVIFDYRPLPSGVDVGGLSVEVRVRDGDWAGWPIVKAFEKQ